MVRNLQVTAGQHDIWLVVLAGHIAVALAWFALMPGGFPIDSPRFWSNRVAPIAVVAAAVAAVDAARRHRPARRGLDQRIVQDRHVYQRGL